MKKIYSHSQDLQDSALSYLGRDFPVLEWAEIYRLCFASVKSLVPENMTLAHVILNATLETGKIFTVF